MSLDLTSRPRDVHDWRDPQALTKSLFPCLLLLSCLPLGLPALALLASTGDPGQNTRTSPGYYACAGPPLLANRSLGGKGGPALRCLSREAWVAIGALGAGQGVWHLVAPARCNPPHHCLDLAGLGNSICACRTLGVFAHGPRGHVLLSWPRSAERGQCPGSGVHLSSFSFSWPRMHQLFSSPSSLTPVQAPSCRSGRRAVHHVLASINPSRSVLGENVRDASPAPFLPRKIS